MDNVETFGIMFLFDPVNLKAEKRFVLSNRRTTNKNIEMYICARKIADR